MASPWDYLKSVTYTKEDIMEDGSDYNAWIINRALSHHADTVAIAAEASKLYNLPPRMQYDFLKGIIRKRKRFSKWPKAETHPDLEIVAAYYKFSTEKAKEALNILDEEDLQHIRDKMSRGGRE